MKQDAPGATRTYVRPLNVPTFGLALGVWAVLGLLVLVVMMLAHGV